MSTQTRSESFTRQHYSPSASSSVFLAGLSRDIWLGALLAISVAANLFLGWAYRDAETEVRMLEYYLLELDAKFINAGLKDPAEAIAKRLQERREDR